MRRHRDDPSFAPDPEPLRRGLHPGSRPASVLAVVAPGVDDPHDARVLLTRRAGRLNTHSGEVAFPGGRVDPEEHPEEAALREAEEEVALPRELVRIVGTLEPITTVVSDAAITTYVAMADAPLEFAALRPNPGEVDRIFDVSLRELILPECYRSEIWMLPEVTYPVFFFDVEDDTIWGATGRLLHRLLTIVTADVGAGSPRDPQAEPPPDRS
jgi:8-oxo-dGTP pyrophosphatase MutT (NUDIX family)